MQRVRRPRDRTGGLYQPGFTEEELRSLSLSNGRPLLDDEIDLLRLLIRRVVSDGSSDEESIDVEAIGRLIDRLGRLLRTRQQVASTSGQGQSDVQMILNAFEKVQSDWSSELRGTRTTGDVLVTREPTETRESTVSTTKEIA